MVNIAPRFTAADIDRKLDDSNSVRNIDLLHFAGVVRWWIAKNVLIAVR